MTPKERAAMQQALDALREYRDTQMIFAPRKAIEALREALEHSCESTEMVQEGKCNQHPDAPHGFDRNASHSAGRYVCECEGWEPEQPVSQEPIGVVNPKGGITYRLGQEPLLPRTHLYTAPQPVKEVELTDDEIVELPNFDGVPIGKRQRIGFARAVIAKYKEKNR